MGIITNIFWTNALLFIALVCIAGLTDAEWTEQPLVRKILDKWSFYTILAFPIGIIVTLFIWIWS